MFSITHPKDQTRPTQTILTITFNINKNTINGDAEQSCFGNEIYFRSWCFYDNVKHDSGLLVGRKKHYADEFSFDMPSQR